jgi:hypothetical protein
MPRLITISFVVSPRLPGLHGGPASFDLPPRSGPLTGWKVTVQRDVILLRSPPGWQPGQRPNEAGTGEEVTVYEVPRSSAALVWSWAPDEVPYQVDEWSEDSPPRPKPDDNVKFPKGEDATSENDPSAQPVRRGPGRPRKVAP